MLFRVSFFIYLIHSIASNFSRTCHHGTSLTEDIIELPDDASEMLAYEAVLELDRILELM
jgi:hypothetical protein